LFWFKKIVSQFLFPVPFSLGLALVGLFLLWFTQKKTAGKILATVGVLLLLMLGYGQVAGRALAPLERIHPALEGQLAPEEPLPQVGYIVVLSSGVTTDDALPLTSQFTAATLSRTVEAVRLYHQIPGAKLLMSGGGTRYDDTPEAVVMADLAQQLGVPQDDILVEPASDDTKDQARIIADMIGDAPFLLVTSAWHMRRSVALFQQQGLDPIPAPTDHLVKSGGKLTPDAFFPSAFDLVLARRAIYEYLGLGWGRLRGLL